MKNKMTIGSKMIRRITKTTVSSTHTANAIRAQTNGGFSTRGTGGSRPVANTGNRTVAKYEQSILGQSRQRRMKAQDEGQPKHMQRWQNEIKDTSNHFRSSNNRFSINKDTASARSSFSAHREPRISGATGATARPAPKPTFRRPS